MEARDMVAVDGRTLTTARLTIRPWDLQDTSAALAVYGDAGVARWLTPAMHEIADATAMGDQLGVWLRENDTLPEPAGRWAITLTESGDVIGGVALLPLPPDDIDLEIGVQLTPAAWGSGLGAEAGHAVAHYAFSNGVDELFAVARPRNHRAAAMARRIGMRWVGETEKYYGLNLQIYRLRKGDLDSPDLTDEHTSGLDDDILGG
jgi:RimJ/RimL family protein N-acetyltransferase